MIRDVILPWAIGDERLGPPGAEDVLEVGPGYGATTDVLSASLAKLTSVEIDDDLFAYLTDRFAGVSAVQIVHADATALDCPDGRFTGAACFTMLHHVEPAERQDQLFAEINRVLKQGAVLVASDSLASEPLADMHHGDTYNPVDPATLEARLTEAGFTDIEVKTNPFGWAAVARKA
ncbi:class I SAM-dependent methyltransferase [soil metagenome]